MVEQEEIQRIYTKRFGSIAEYRRKVWGVLVMDFFQQMIPEVGAVLDLGCGYGEFINTVKAGRKYAMDLNPDTRGRLNQEVTFIHQDCSLRWPLDAGALDLVFTSNFFEHLPDKGALGSTLDQVAHCLKPGGRLIAVGPNIRFTGGRYWDFWDHYIPLTEASMSEAMSARGLEIERCCAQFLPYSMTSGPRYPLWMLRLYLRVPVVWRVAGKQFLVVARKPADAKA